MTGFRVMPDIDRINFCLKCGKLHDSTSISCYLYQVTNVELLISGYHAREINQFSDYMYLPDLVVRAKRARVTKAIWTNIYRPLIRG